MNEVEVISATFEPTEHGRSFRVMLLQKTVRASEDMDDIFETGYDCVRISGNCQIFANRGDYKFSFFKQNAVERDIAQASYNRHKADVEDALCFCKGKEFPRHMDYIDWLEKFIALGVKRCV